MLWVITRIGDFWLVTRGFWVITMVFIREVLDSYNIK